MRKLVKYLKPYIGLVILAPLLMLLEVVTELNQPKLMSKIINIGIGSGNISYILKTGSLMLLLCLIGILGGVGCLIAASNASQRFGRDVRNDLFEKIQRFSFRNLDMFKPSSLITRLTNDITQIQLLVLMSLRITVRAPLIVVGSTIMAHNMNPELTKIFLILVPFILVSIIITIKFASPIFKTVQERLDKVNLVMRENLSGIRVIKAFVRSDYERKKFNIVNEEYKNINIKAFNIVIIIMPTVIFILNLGIILVVWFGGVQVQQGTMLVGDIMAFITYLTQILISIIMFAMTFIFISRAKASSDRIVEVLETNTDIADNKDSIRDLKIKGNIEYKDVYFKYENDSKDPILKKINFTAKPGETIAILGMTGSGKSSLVNLMPRLYDVTEGEILIDNINVKDISLDTLREQISMILQDTILFSGTIKENILWGKEDATDEEIEEVAKVSQAHDFIMSFPDKYDTYLDQRGVNLSGGQKQRIAIARALIKKPPIIIFDDSTSAVDMATEKRIQEELNNSMKDSTKFIIAQRISSVKNADKILVIKDGSIIAEGNHNNLMETSSDYKEIYSSQLGNGVVFDE